MPNEVPVVVVRTHLTIEMRDDGKMFAGRLKRLGLTAYARTAEGARGAVLRLFNQWVNLHRNQGEGVLEQRLDQLGVAHEPLDSYSGQAPIVDTRKLVATGISVTNATTASSIVAHRGERLAVADGLDESVSDAAELRRPSYSSFHGPSRLAA